MCILKSIRYNFDYWYSSSFHSRRCDYSILP
ncbi:hypothetical protein T4C_10654 [Trichinella pseudospiralis]|uniref:Uncharacterized protein n=1 Tax=Trichinella pseudospiralis TaxID=6337 RepID=A0A0V1GIE6_TRIPS|nr:hypothetical protein T4C_10654 [Trichinella pseudospiralis]